MEIVTWEGLDHEMAETIQKNIYDIICAKIVQRTI